jgi:uncharacterized protein (TIGR02246 family)
MLRSCQTRSKFGLKHNPPLVKVNWAKWEAAIKTLPKQVAPYLMLRYNSHHGLEVTFDRPGITGAARYFAGTKGPYAAYDAIDELLELVKPRAWRRLMPQTHRLTAEDRLDIMDLIARYASTLDAGDLDGYVNNFAPDGVLFERHNGREQIRAYVASLMREGRAGPLPSGDVAYRHFVGSPTINGSEDRATVHSYLLWVSMGSEPPISAAAEYLDECVKIDGEWLFKTRTLRRLAGRFPGSEPVIAQQSMSRLAGESHE